MHCSRILLFIYFSVYPFLPLFYTVHGVLMTRILQWFAIPSSSGPHFVKEESEKASLKLSVKIAKIVESSPITSWQIEGEKLEAVTDFRFLGSKITADGDCCHKIRR